jgi:hypothetical protein
LRFIQISLSVQRRNIGIDYLWHFSFLFRPFSGESTRLQRSLLWVNVCSIAADMALYDNPTKFLYVKIPVSTNLLTTTPFYPITKQIFPIVCPEKSYITPEKAVVSHQAQDSGISVHYVIQITRILNVRLNY